MTDETQQEVVTEAPKVPSDSVVIHQWLNLIYKNQEKQNRHLKAISFAVQFMAIMVLISAIVAGCSLIFSV